MNALTEKLPAHDDVIEDFEWSTDTGLITADLLIEKYGTGETYSDSFYASEIYDWRIVGLHFGGNFMIDRDGMEQISSKSAVEAAEASLNKDREVAA